MRRLVLFTSLLVACEPAPEADSFEVAPSGAWACRPAETGWGFQKLGPVRGLPDPAAPGEGAISPALVEHDGVLHLWYAQKSSGTSYALLHAESRDGGESFTSPVPVTGLIEGSIQAYPAVWRERETFHLVYGSGSFKRATSADGVRFTPAPAVMSASGDPEQFDGLSILYPSVVRDGGAATIFFTGFDGRRLRIGRATEREGGRFAVDPPRPVIDLGAASDFDNAAVAQPHVVRAGGRWWMWYGGYDTSTTNPGPYRVGSASSVDGVAWEKHGVAIELGARGTDAWSTRDPALVVSRGRWLMFYTGLGDDGRYRLHRAASGVCPPAEATLSPR